MSVSQNDTKTFLSDQIQTLLIPLDLSKHTSNGHNFVNANLLLKWDKISKIFDKNDEYSTFSYEFCLSVIGRLHPVWHEIEQCGRNIKSLENLEWTGCAEEIINDFEMRDQCATKYLENILFLTSIIEHGLGDIYSTIKSTAPPHLLRDLIASTELKSLFSDEQILFLQILIGHPNGVNLRNIVWHGFPSVVEIATCHYFTLLSIISSFGHIIKENNFQIKYRNVSYETVSLFDKIVLPPIDINIIIQFEVYLLTSKYIAPCHTQIWNQILEYYNKKNYRSGIILLIPQIEMTMRLMYSDFNGIDVTAKIDQYYFILDTILEEFLDVEKLVKNNIYTKLNSCMLKLIYDIFQSQTGPRIRDKISHGDLLSSKLNFGVFELLLNLAYHLINFNNIKYEIVYHPNRVLVDKFQFLFNSSIDIATINIPNGLLIDNRMHNLISINFNVNDFQNLQIFYRVKVENEIIGLLIQIIENLNIALNNLINNLKIRIELFQKFLLHSKRRETLKNFVSNLDVVLNEGIYKIVNLIITFYGKIQNANCLVGLEDKQIQNIIKFLKKILKYSENVAKYLNIDHNQWLESIKLTQDVTKLFSSKTNVLILLK